jgi:predicted ATPase
MLNFGAMVCFLLDEPEAALSPQRQLAFLVLMHAVIRKFKHPQFMISSHSPVLVGVTFTTFTTVILPVAAFVLGFFVYG